MKSTKTMIYIMLAVLFAGAAYLFYTGHDDQGALKGIDPESYDIETSCTEIDGNTLTCNEGNDMYLVLSGTKVYKQKIKTTISENGDVKTENIFSDITSSDLKKTIEDTGSVNLRLWMTPNGKIDCVMMVEEVQENKCETLKNLEGLDPGSYNALNLVTAMDTKTITLAPVNYTEENKDKLAEFVKQYNFSSNVKFYHIDIVEEVSMKENEEVRTMKHIEYSKSDFEGTKNLLATDRQAYIWFDKAGNVENVVTVLRTTGEKESK